MTSCVLTLQLEIPQIPHNLFDLSAQIGQLFGIFLKKALITCPLSMVILFCFVIQYERHSRTFNMSFFNHYTYFKPCSTLYSFILLFFVLIALFRNLLGSLRMSFFLFKKVCKGILAKKQDFAYLDLMQGPGK